MLCRRPTATPGRDSEPMTTSPVTPSTTSTSTVSARSKGVLGRIRDAGCHTGNVATKNRALLRAFIGTGGCSLDSESRWSALVRAAHGAWPPPELSTRPRPGLLWAHAGWRAHVGNFMSTMAYAIAGAGG